MNPCSNDSTDLSTMVPELDSASLSFWMVRRNGRWFVCGRAATVDADDLPASAVCNVFRIAAQKARHPCTAVPDTHCSSGHSLTMATVHNSNGRVCAAAAVRMP